MPLFAYTKHGLVVNASDCTAEDEFFCCQCKLPLCFVRGSERGAAHFRHVHRNEKCSDSWSQAEEERVRDLDPTVVNRAMTSWHASWQSLAHESHVEAHGIGDDRKRPRDLGDVERNAILELQHSRMTSEEFDARNAGVDHATWIFDATAEPLMRYEYGEDLWFCPDKFHHMYPSGPACTVLFQCGDRSLYQTVCDSPLRIDVNGKSMHIRLLTKIDGTARRELNHFFRTGWPLSAWDDAPIPQCPSACDGPISVLSESGRPEIDRAHRAFMHRFPTAPCTVVSAPPGAGKTSAILEMIRHWGVRALVVTFNTATKDTMEQRFREAGINAAARTIDSLCYEACERPELMKWSDWGLCTTFWERSAHTKFNKQGGGRRSHNIVDFRFRHPQATHVICKKHQRLGVKGRPWDADLASFPMHYIVQGHYNGKACSTHAGCRYVCDRDGKLASKLDKYDIVLVDEMQDLMSAQEQRLLFQTKRPIVLVGDFMQAINNFRDDPPCTACQLRQEVPAKLPRAIEWYGTWRLDAFTAKFIEERFGRRMYSYRTVGAAKVYWKDELVHEHNTFVMCRSNKHVVEIVVRYPHIRVVNGESLAAKLIAASKDDSTVTPMADYAHKLAAAEQLESVCALLGERNIRLSDVRDLSAVSTVHQAKGFEYDHCAVHADLLTPTTEEECNISFVAFTRHKKSLVVLDDGRADGV